MRLNEMDWIGLDQISNYLSLFEGNRSAYLQAWGIFRGCMPRQMRGLTVRIPLCWVGWLNGWRRGEGKGRNCRINDHLFWAGTARVSVQVQIVELCFAGGL